LASGFGAILLFSCGNKDNGGSSPSDTGGDAGAFVFQPQGCGYTVSTVDGLPALEPNGDVLGADATPKHVRIGLGGGVDASAKGYADPSTSFAVLWETDASTMASKIRVAASPSTFDIVTPTTGASALVPQELGQGPDDGVRFHEAHVCGLQPGTTYYYQVGGGPAGGEVWSTTQSVTTLPAKGSSDALLVGIVGDTRANAGPVMPGNDPALPVWKAISGRLQIAGARLALFSGDTVLVGADESMWDHWTDDSDALAGSTLVAMAPGNHENELVRYFAHVVMPGSTKNAERYASFDAGPVHVLMIDDYDGVVAPTIDSTGYANELLAWLETDLARADGNRASVPWIVTYHHHPAYDSGADTARVKERQAVQNALVPLFDKHHVDLDLAGHDHFYERSKPLVAGAVATKGTTYLVDGAGGAPSYTTNPGNPLSQTIVHYDPTANQGIYGLMTASATTLDVKMYQLSGTGGSSPADDAVVDQLTLTR
jgi:hypothetical protein